MQIAFGKRMIAEALAHFQAAMQHQPTKSKRRHAIAHSFTDEKGVLPAGQGGCPLVPE